MQKRVLVATALLLVLILAAACAPNAAPAPAAPAQAAPKPAPVAVAAPKAPTQQAWQVKWDAMTEGAKKEGKVVIYSTSNAETRTAFQRAFKDKFGVSAEFIAVLTAQMGPKVLAERKAGLRLADLVMGSGTSSLLVLKPAGAVEPIEVGDVLVLPEFTDPKLWLNGKLLWQDTSHLSLQYSKFESHVVARNTEMVKEGEVQSYNDLLNPKWKGKIIVNDPTKAGVSLKGIAMVGRYTMGWDWVRSLVKQEPGITSDPRLQVEWLARGKYPLAYGVKKDVLFEFKQMGLPVASIYMREGPAYFTGGSGMISLLKDSAHPNAARLFLNWLLTKEGQTIFTQTGGYPSIRLDVSDEAALNPRAGADVKAPDGDTEEAMIQQDEDVRIIKEIFAPILGK